MTVAQSKSTEYLLSKAKAEHDRAMVTKWMGDCFVLGFTAWGQLLWTVQTQQKFF